MKVHDVAVDVTLIEGGAVNMSIGQVKEVMWIINYFTGGELYKWIRKVKPKEEMREVTIRRIRKLKNERYMRGKKQSVRRKTK